MQASPARHGLLVLVAGNFSLYQNRWGSQTNASIPRDRRGRARHCRRWLRPTLGDVPRGAACRRGGRLECALLPRARAPSPLRFTAAPEDAPLRSVYRASPCCGKPYRTAPPTRPTRSLRPHSSPSSTPPEVCLETMEFDFQRRHGTTTTTHAPHSSPKVAWDTTSTRCQVGRSWRLRLHEQRLTW